MAKSKKETKKVMEEAEKHEQERRAAIADFNMQHQDVACIDPDRVPTDEEIESAKKDFEDFLKALQEKKDYVVADKANALRVAKFMDTFIQKNVWAGRAFVGVLNFHALLKKFIEDFKEDEPVELSLEYAPMQFAYLMFENYGGVGIEGAEWMAENWDEYLPIYEKLHELVDWHEAQTKKAEALKERWAAMSQGYYMVLFDEKPAEPAEETNEASVSDAAEETDVANA